MATDIFLDHPGYYAVAWRFSNDDGRGTMNKVCILALEQKVYVNDVVHENESINPESSDCSSTFKNCIWVHSGKILKH